MINNTRLESTFWHGRSVVITGAGAIIAIPYSYVHPVETASSNFMSTLNILEACRRHDVRRLIHTSTSEVYGTALRIPIDETQPQRG